MTAFLRPRKPPFVRGEPGSHGDQWLMSEADLEEYARADRAQQMDLPPYLSVEQLAAWLHLNLHGYVDAKAVSSDALRVPLTEWQPIETAPMDGQKVILFYLNRNNFRRTVMARWVTDEQAAETDADDVGLEAGWYECIDNWDDYCQVCIHEGEPTHWMPLPPPPVERAHGIEEAKR